MAIEIEKVANGWMVRPGYDMARRGEAIDVTSVYVFETFGSLVEHLEAVLWPEKPSPTVEDDEASEREAFASGLRITEDWMNTAVASSPRVFRQIKKIMNKGGGEK